MKKVLLAISALSLVLVTGCGDDDPLPVSPLMLLNQAGELAAVEGVWSTCEDSGGGDSERTVLTFVGSGGTFVNTEFTGSTDCTTGAGTPTNGTFTMTTSGDKSISWDIAGIPTNFSNPVTATTGTLVLTIPGLGNFETKNVLVVDTIASPNVIYGKSDDDGGPVGADGFPDDITLTEPLIKQ